LRDPKPEFPKNYDRYRNELRFGQLRDGACVCLSDGRESIRVENHLIVFRLDSLELFLDQPIDAFRFPAEMLKPSYHFHPGF